MTNRGCSGRSLSRFRTGPATIAALLLMACGGGGQGSGGAEDGGGGDGDAGQPSRDAGHDGGDSGGPDGGKPAAVVLARFTSDGTPDPTFGAAGVAEVDLGSGGSLYHVAKDAEDRLVLFGSRRGEAPRTDTDRVVARVTREGTLDTTFADAGIDVFTLGSLSDQQRKGLVQADGKILSAGYTSQPTGVGAQLANRIVLLRLNPDGSRDPSFGVGGVVNSGPFIPENSATTPWGMAEAYAVGWQPGLGRYVTTGYGRTAASGPVDVVSFAYQSSGERDGAFGNAGSSVLDVAGDNDRGRDLTVLPDERVIIVGSGAPSSMNADAMVAVLTSAGQPEPTFGAGGYKLYDFGRADEALFGVAADAAGTQIAAAGYRAGPVGGAAEDDDAVLVLLSMTGGAERAQATPLSETEHDRFWSVAFDSQGRVYAAGFVTEGGDAKIALARFGPDGALDPTFGNGGVVRLNLAASGTPETARSVVVLGDGKVVIGANIGAP